MRVGAQVKIVGLQRNEEMNGAVGSVVGGGRGSDNMPRVRD